MRIVFHGRLAGILGREMELPGSEPCSVAELRQLIAESRPEAAEALTGKRVRACVEDTIVPDSHVVEAGAEVEFLPPVSGG